MFEREVSVDACSGRVGSDEVAALFAEHAPFVRRVLRRFGVREPDVHDACQDVFVVVHRKLPEFEGRAAHRTWIFRIAVRTASDYRKRAHRRYERLAEPEACEPVNAPQVEPELDPELVQRAWRALAKLDEDKRRVFVLHELDELTMPEVAAALGCPLKTAFSRFYAARKLLATELQRGRAGWSAGLFLLFPRTLPAEWLRALDRAAELDPSALAGASAAGTVGAAGSFALGSQLLHAGAALVLATAVVAHEPSPAGAMLVTSVPSAERATTYGARAPKYVLASARAALARPPAPPQPILRRQPKPATPREAPDRAPVEATPPQWVQAPARAPMVTPERPAARRADLDEVLEATSIRDSMRFGPASRKDSAAFMLLPAGRAKSESE